MLSHIKSGSARSVTSNNRTRCMVLILSDYLSRVLADHDGYELTDGVMELFDAVLHRLQITDDILSNLHDIVLEELNA